MVQKLQNTRHGRLRECDAAARSVMAATRWALLGIVSVTHWPYSVATLMMLSLSLCSYLTVLTHAPRSTMSTGSSVGVTTMQAQQFDLKHWSEHCHLCQYPTWWLVHINSDFAGKHGWFVLLALNKFTGQEVWWQYTALYNIVSEQSSGEKYVTTQSPH